MPTGPNSLLVGGATGWHTGNQNITYSFIGSELPAYYPKIDQDGNGTLDHYDMSSLDPSTLVNLPITTTEFSMTPAERALAQLAIQAWNDVANINLVAGSIDGGGEIGAPITGDGTLVAGLGGATGYGEQALPRNDDGSTFVNIAAVFENGLDFFGINASSVWVNTNGNISFNSAISTYTPTGITGGITPMIAPFWADVDTRTNGAPDSQPIYVDIDTVNDVVTFTWHDVGYYFFNATHLNSFQLQLFDRGGGDFDIVFRYEDITWTTGQASHSGGNADGLGGNVAHAGYTAGNGDDFFELPASGNQAAVLDLENAVGNTGQQGLWVFEVRDGEIAAGDVTFGASDFDLSFFGFVSDFPGTLGTPSDHGDVWVNHALPAQASASLGNTGWQTFLHELGHGIGLHHPDEDPNNNAGDPTNNNQYTVMSYVAHPGVSAQPSAQQAWPVTPMLYDITAIQQLYGANLDTRTGNTSYFGPGGVYGLTDGGLLTGTTFTGMATIWDAGGTDTVDASNQTNAVTIDLAPGSFSTIGGIANNIAMANAVTVSGTIVNYVENANGGAGADTLRGNATDNLLDGRGGADTMHGFGGNDTYIVDNANDVVQDEGIGQGTLDRVEATVNYTLGTGVHVERMSTTADTGTAAIDLTGNERDQIIVGNNGVNRLEGGGGLDTLQGLGGDDTYFVDSANDVVVEVAGEGTLDWVRASVDYALAAGANVEKLTTRSSGGTTAIDLTGNELAQTIIGNAGVNRIDGRGGIDLMQGLAGNDTYIVDNAGDIIVEVAGGGTLDWVAASVSYTLAADDDIEKLTTRSNGGTTAIDLTGNDLAQSITGNAGVNRLDGRGGIDTMQGLGGNDTYIVDNASDVVLEVAGGGANDWVAASVSYALAAAAHVEKLTTRSNGGTTAIDLTGNSIGQSITGNAGMNRIEGRGGLDTMQGLGGNDTFVFSAASHSVAGVNRDVIQDFEDFGDNDTIDLSGFAGTYNFIDAAAFSGTANEVRAVQSGANVLIQINAAGNTTAESEILLANTLISQVTGTDFLLT